MPAPVVVAFGEYRSWLRDHLALRRPCEFVLVDVRASHASAGGPVTTGSLREQFDAMVRRAGLRRSLTPHQLRHFYGTELARSGEALHVIQSLVGHASIVSTQTYLHRRGGHAPGGRPARLRP